MVEADEQMTRDELAQALAHSQEKRERLLKLLSMNHFDMEENNHSFYELSYNCLEKLLVKGEKE